MTTDDSKAATPAKESTAKGGGDKLLYRVVKVPEGKKCLRVKIGKNGWRWYPGHKPTLSEDQAAQVEKLCPGALQLIPQL
jgi:hypothetical protein